MNPRIVVTASSGIKCPRCWNYHYLQYNFDGLCDRCCSVILRDYPEHESVPGIVEAYEQQRARWSLTPIAELNPTKEN